MLYVSLLTLVLLLVVDFAWLNYIAKNFYRGEFGSLLKSNFNLISGILTYLLIVSGILIFVLNSSYVDSLSSAFIVGTIFGLVVYGVYDLTSFSILKGFSIRLAVVDIIWGSFLCGFLSLFARYLSIM